MTKKTRKSDDKGLTWFTRETKGRAAPLKKYLISRASRLASHKIPQGQDLSLCVNFRQSLSS